jgi:hypothetical protein
MFNLGLFKFKLDSSQYWWLIRRYIVSSQSTERFCEKFGNPSEICISRENSRFIMITHILFDVVTATYLSPSKGRSK